MAYCYSLLTLGTNKKHIMGRHKKGGNFGGKTILTERRKIRKIAILESMMALQPFEYLKFYHDETSANSVYSTLIKVRTIRKRTGEKLYYKVFTEDGVMMVLCSNKPIGKKANEEKERFWMERTNKGVSIVHRTKKGYTRRRYTENSQLFTDWVDGNISQNKLRIAYREQT